MVHPSLIRLECSPFHKLYPATSSRAENLLSGNNFLIIIYFDGCHPLCVFYWGFYHLISIITHYQTNTLINHLSHCSDQSKANILNTNLWRHYYTWFVTSEHTKCHNNCQCELYFTTVTLCSIILKCLTISLTLYCQWFLAFTNKASSDEIRA